MRRLHYQHHRTGGKRGDGQVPCAAELTWPSAGRGRTDTADLEYIRLGGSQFLVGLRAQTAVVRGASCGLSAGSRGYGCGRSGWRRRPLGRDGAPPILRVPSSGRDARSAPRPKKAVIRAGGMRRYRHALKFWTSIRVSIARGSGGGRHQVGAGRGVD